MRAATSPTGSAVMRTKRSVAIRFTSDMPYLTPLTRRSSFGAQLTTPEGYPRIPMMNGGRAGFCPGRIDNPGTARIIILARRQKRQGTQGESVPKPVSETAIAVRDVVHSFGESDDPRRVLALNNLSLDIKRGELVCFIGPSGCGKSTMLNMIGGLLAPSEGEVRIRGDVV